MHQNVSKKSFL